MLRDNAAQHPAIFYIKHFSDLGKIMSKEKDN